MKNRKRFLCVKVFVLLMAIMVLFLGPTYVAGEDLQKATYKIVWTYNDGDIIVNFTKSEMTIEGNKITGEVEGVGVEKFKWVLKGEKKGNTIKFKCTRGGVRVIIAKGVLNGDTIEGKFTNFAITHLGDFTLFGRFTAKKTD